MPSIAPLPFSERQRCCGRGACTAAHQGPCPAAIVSLAAHLPSCLKGCTKLKREGGEPFVCPGQFDTTSRLCCQGRPEARQGGHDKGFRQNGFGLECMKTVRYRCLCLFLIFLFSGSSQPLVSFSDSKTADPVIAAAAMQPLLVLAVEDTTPCPASPAPCWSLSSPNHISSLPPFLFRYAYHALGAERHPIASSFSRASPFLN